MESKLHDKRISSLRELMKVNGLDGYFIPHEDSHFSEYVSNKDKRLEYISNFSGSSGFCIVTIEHAILFSDPRYDIQARRELDSSIWMFALTRLFHGKPVEEFVEGYLEKDMKIGIDPMIISSGDYRKFEMMLKSNDIELISLSENLVDMIWKEKPEDDGKIFIHEEKYSGESYQSKLRKIRLEMKKDKIDFLLLSSIDEIAWTCNLRGNNLIPYCGTFPSWLIIEEDQATLFINEELFEDNQLIKQFLQPSFTLRKYEDFIGYLKDLSETLRNNNLKSDDSGTTHEKVMLDERKLSQRLTSILPPENIVVKTSPVVQMKMLKNEVEISGFRSALERDCAALVLFYRWIESKLENDPNSDSLTEYNASVVLENFRKSVGGEMFISSSFETICSVGSNAAVIHYHADENAPMMKKINKEEILLLDSGGNYRDGTTDTTRTRFFGDRPPKEEIRMYYTHVLKGHIAFARVVFPEKNTRYKFHSLARIPLWSVGYDYPHGTSHGVGTCLNVHEEPYLSGSFLPCLDCIITIEPGCYFEEKNFGIRIENMYAIRKHTEHSKFLRLECLTFFPFQKKMIMKELLNNEEIDFVNWYHAMCREKLLPFFEGEEDGDVKEWIIKETLPL